MHIRAYYAVFVPEDDGRAAVWFPDIPGCATWGENMEHAFVMALDALEGHLQAMADDGDPIPEPSTRAEAMEAVRHDFETEGETMPEGLIFQLVPVPDMDEKPARVNVSFRKSTLAMIDKKAESAGMTRSGFLSRAAEAFEVSSSL